MSEPGNSGKAYHGVSRSMDRYRRALELIPGGTQLVSRRPTRYADMDFWSDARTSVFRPRYLIEDMQDSPGFMYRNRRLVVSFREEEDGVRVLCRNTDGAGLTSYTARRLILCAGAIQSARIAMNALGLAGIRVILSEGWRSLASKS